MSYLTQASRGNFSGSIEGGPRFMNYTSSFQYIDIAHWTTPIDS